MAISSEEGNGYQDFTTAGECCNQLSDYTTIIENVSKRYAVGYVNGCCT